MTVKRIYLGFAIMIAAITLSSCGTVRYFSDFTTADAVGNMVMLGPAATHYYIDENDKEEYSDSLSVITEGLITKLTKKSGMPVSAYLDLDDAQKEEAVAFMRYLYTIKPKRVGECQIPSDLDDMLEASGYRYGLLVYDNGMTRSTKGFLKSAALGLAIGILTTICTFGMFTYYPYAVPYSSDMNMAILDSETNRVVFYNYAPNNDRNPSLQYDLLKQLAYLYRDFIR